MKIILIVLLSFSSSLFAQEIDYNTKKGFAVKGYDVVSYFGQKAIEGDKKITAKYDGVTYKFYSEKNRDTFISNPEKYLPQYGGYCAYAIAVKSKKVDINPKTFEIRDGKLYLFYNAWGTNTLELWEKENVKGLIEKADKHWVAIRVK